MRVGGAASAPPHPGVRGFADAGMTTPAAPRNIPAAQGHVPVHRLSEEQGLGEGRKEGAPVTGITRWSLQHKRLVASFWLVLALPSAPRDRHRR